MDIDLNGESGLDCAKIMTELNPKVKMIFATAHSEFMANAFEIYAFDYLVKPFNLERVEKTLSRIKDMVNEGGNNTVIEGESLGAKVIKTSEQNGEKLIIKGKEQLTFIDKKDIIMVERIDGVTFIITADDTFQTSLSLGSIEEKLCSEKFMRCHKSYIINISMISRIETYGRWTYVVKLKNTNNTALITAQKYDDVKRIYE